MDPMQDAVLAIGAEIPVVNWDGSSGEAEISARFAADLPVFGGHFPGQPLVPGVHQVALLTTLFRLASDQPCAELRQILRCKWTLPLTPEDNLRVKISWQPHQQAGMFKVQGSVLRAALSACQCQLLICAAP